MAKTIIEDDQLSRYSLRSWAKVVGFGALTGVVFWLIAALISSLVVEPLSCRQLVDAAACVNATPTAGRVATILVAALAIAGMVRLGVFRPIIIAVATACLLWPLSSYTLGLSWFESLLWSVLLYALLYALFGWIARASSSIFAIVASFVIVIIVSIALI